MRKLEERPFNVLYAEPLPPDLASIARQAVPPGFQLRFVRSKHRDELLAELAEADFLLVATTHVDEEALSAAPRLRHVQHQGVGYNNIDLVACGQAGVTVALTPEGTTVGVAEHTLLLILALYKHLLETDAAVRGGTWPVWEFRSTSFELAGKTVGLVGFGRIGRAIAARARAFEARVVYYDPVRPPLELEAELGVRSVSLDELLTISDIVSLHVPLTPETNRLVGERELALMRPHALLINTARGPLIDEAALVAALRAGKIAGAGLDVFEFEPPQATNPLLHLHNVVVTPHISAGTRDAFVTKMQAAFANMRRVSAGEAPFNQVFAS